MDADEIDARVAALVAALERAAGDDGAGRTSMREFSRGSYSFTAVGSGESDREALSEPIDGRLWLAGEASHPTFHSTVHGGWLSGRAAAEQATR